MNTVPRLNQAIHWTKSGKRRAPRSVAPRQAGNKPAWVSRWQLLAGGLLLLVGAAIAAAYLSGFPGVRHAAGVVPYPHDLAQVSFAVAGDVIPHEPVRVAAAAAGQGSQG